MGGWIDGWIEGAAPLLTPSKGGTYKCARLRPLPTRGRANFSSSTIVKSGLGFSKRVTRCSMSRWSGGAHPPLHRTCSLTWPLAVRRMLMVSCAPPQMDFHPRVCKRGFVVWFVRRSLAALSCCWSKITVSRFINILRRIEELSGPWRGQEGAGGEDCWVCQQFKQSRWINTKKPRRRRQIIAPILFYFIFLVVVVVVFLQWVFFSLLRGSYWLEVGSFFPSSNQKQEQGFSEELSHIPSACVLSIKRDVACGALLHFISLFISFTNAWTVEYCIG